MSNIIKEAEKIMSAFLDGIEAKIKNLTGNHGIDNTHLNDDIKTFITDTVTDAVADVKAFVDQQSGDIADLKQAMNDAVDHLSEDNNDAATQTLKTSLETAGTPSAPDSTVTAGAATVNVATAAGQISTVSTDSATTSTSDVDSSTTQGELPGDATATPQSAASVDTGNVGGNS